jgi:hypothetical protein
MNQIRSKIPVLIDGITRKQAVIYIRTANVIFTPNRSYEATIVYSIAEDEEEEIPTSFRIIDTRTAKFTIEEANELEIGLQIVGTTVSQRLEDIIPKLTMYQAGVSGVFGLRPEDFEFYQI